MTDLANQIERLSAAATDIRDFVEQGGYEVEASGTVYSHKTNWRGYGKRALKAGVNHHGYTSVCLMVNGVRKHLAVHRLVAAFHLPPKPSAAHEIRHINGNRLDPRADNLDWGTRKQNAADRDLHGKTAIGERNGFSRLSDDERRQIAADARPKRAIARAYGVDDKTIRRIKSSKHWGNCHVG